MFQATRRGAAAILIVLASFFALVATSPAIAQPDLSKRAVITVGVGGLTGSYGAINAADHENDFGKTLNTAFQALVAQGGGFIDVLPGAYTAKTPAAIGGMSFAIRMAPNAIVTVDVDNSTSPAILAAFDCDSSSIQGGRFKTTHYVASQTIVKFTRGKDTLLRDTVFEATINQVADSTTTATPTARAAPTGSTTTPMVMLEFDTALRKTIDRCSFLPDYAVTCLKSTNGAGIVVTHSQFANNVDAGLQGLSVDTGPAVKYLDNAAPRLCWRGVQIDGDEWGTIDGCRFWGLGDSNYDPGTGSIPYYTGAPYELDFIVRVKSSTDIPTGSLSTTQSESGHFRVQNNTAEWCAAPKAFQVWGAPSVVFTGNLFGLDPSPNASGEGIIVLTDGDDSGTGSDVIKDAVIVGNDIHNPALSGTGGVGVFARMTKHLQIKANFIGTLQSTYGVEISGSTIESAAIVANTFRGNGTNSTNPIHVTSGSGVTNGLYVAANDYTGFTTAVCVKNDSSIGTEYYVGDAITSGSLTTSVTVTATNEINRASGSFLTDGFQVGDVIYATGLTAAGDNGKLLFATTVAALKITVAGTPLTNQAGATTSTITRANGRAAANVKIH